MLEEGTSVFYNGLTFGYITHSRAGFIFWSTQPTDNGLHSFSVCFYLVIVWYFVLLCFSFLGVVFNFVYLVWGGSVAELGFVLIKDLKLGGYAGGRI